MRRQPDFVFPKARDRGWWIAIAAALVVHLIILSVEAVGWFWAEGGWFAVAAFIATLLAIAFVAALRLRRIAP